MFISKNRNLVKILSVWIFDFLKKKEKKKKDFLSNVICLQLFKIRFKVSIIHNW